jgi:prepilin-type N-terminal cleavage/methylation domain-containing protein
MDPTTRSCCYRPRPSSSLSLGGLRCSLSRIRPQYKKTLCAGRGSAADRGFTLIELLVVITILAVLTMIAVQSLGPVEEKARHEATTRTLNHVRDSIVSTNDSAVAGFIADTGRLPTSLPDLTGVASPGGVLQPNDLPAYGVLNVQSGPDWNGSSWAITPGTSGSFFSLNRGWHGPYLQPSAGTNDVVDGWGYSLITDVQGVGTFGVGPAGITLRARGKPGGVPPQTVIPSGNYSATQISGNIYSATTDTGPWCVMLVGPGSAAESGIAVHCVTATLTGAVTTTTGGGSSTGQPVATYSITASSPRLEGGTLDARALYVGPRVLCAAKGNASSATRTGAPQPVVVRPGAQSFDLYVP